ncbi:MULTISPECIES: hypothetical protein [unclassified Undibacterium]|uniref:hypothetical protein n=1 Tax=unclassified Undibacterium TaxID=2630295 RepID=UPI003C2B7519
MTSWFYMHENVTNAQQTRFFWANMRSLGEIMLDFYLQNIFERNFSFKIGQTRL